MGACEDRGARCGDLVENGFVVEIGRVDRRLLERAAQVLFWRARYDAAECARRSHAHASQWLRLTPAGPAPQQARPRPTPGACHAARSGSQPRPLRCLEQQLSSDPFRLPQFCLPPRTCRPSLDFLDMLPLMHDFLNNGWAVSHRAWFGALSTSPRVLRAQCARAAASWAREFCALNGA